MQYVYGIRIGYGYIHMDCIRNMYTYMEYVCMCICICNMCGMHV